MLRHGTAAAEIGTSLLLLFGRTARLGLLATVVVLLHLLLVNLAHPVALPVVLLLLLVTAVLIGLDLPALRAVVRDNALRPPALGTDPTGVPSGCRGWWRDSPSTTNSTASTSTRLPVVRSARGAASRSGGACASSTIRLRPSRVTPGAVPEPTRPKRKLDASYRLSEDDQRSHLEDRARGVEIELERHR